MDILSRKPDGAFLLGLVAIVVAGLVLAIIGTVIFAGIPGTFVLSSGEQVNPSGEQVSSAPAVSFQFGSGDGTATVEHAGGDTFAADEVLVVAGGAEQSWGSLSGEDGVVDPGDSVSFEVASGETVELVYIGGGEREPIGRFTA
ncbi:type IV pilin [Haloferax sp. DFSO60]|uniref:type IV pilin n=1 Tax=Haloferax sp. DFSO60 TaxID=3388652 RepID=UPI00397B3C51